VRNVRQFETFVVKDFEEDVAQRRESNS